MVVYCLLGTTVFGCPSSVSKLQVNVSGEWVGTIGLENASLPIRFSLRDENGKLSGKTFLGDPETRELLEDGTLSGQRTDYRATWTTTTDLKIEGTFSTERFAGTLEFPKEDDTEAVVTSLQLTLQR
jgi:hypothetical protein